MSITKKARAALLVMLFSISILPGCGKNKDGDAGIIGTNLYGAIPGGVVNGCINLYGQTSGVTLYFAGTVTVFGGSISSSTLGISGSGLPGPEQFTRNDTAGDHVGVYLTGNTAYVQANLSALTVQAINSGGGLVCGFGFDNVLIGNPLSGRMGPVGQGGGPALDAWRYPIYM